MSIMTLIFIIIAIGIAFLFLVLVKTGKPRSRSAPAVAEQLGFNFFEKDNEILEKIKFFKLYDITTRNASARNVYRAKKTPPDVCVFDYEATTGPEDAPATDTHTTFYFKDDRMKLPGFRLLPENSEIARRNNSVLKYRPISFASNPAFSSRFRLVGPDGHEIREFFSSDLLDFFEKQGALCTEGFKSELLVYQPKKKVAPADFKKYFDNARSIFDLFLERSKILPSTPENAEK